MSPTAQWWLAVAAFTGWLLVRFGSYIVPLIAKIPWDAVWKARSTVMDALVVGVFVVLMFGGVKLPGCTPFNPFTPAGPRTIFIVRESGGNVPTEVQALAVALRDGPTSAALATKGHKLLVLDNDDAAISKFGPFDDSKAELLICDGDKLLSREPLPLTVDTFVAALKARGISW